jgi:hypothetical protein
MSNQFDTDDANDQGSITGTQDLTYNLISVIYHALQGAETCERYLKDAYAQDDGAFVHYLHEVQRLQQQIADKGKGLLRQRLT